MFLPIKQFPQIEKFVIGAKHAIYTSKLTMLLVNSDSDNLCFTIRVSIQVPYVGTFIQSLIYNRVRSLYSGTNVYVVGRIQLMIYILIIQL